MLNATRINPLDPVYRPLLEDLQVNILKAHGRDHSALVLLSFDRARLGDVRTWIAHAGKFVSSAYDLADEARDFALDGIPGQTVCSLMLSAAGCHALGWLDRVPRSDGLPLAAHPRRPFDRHGRAQDGESDYFTLGMRRTARMLGDGTGRDANPWESPYADDTIDALLLVAADIRDHIDIACQRALLWPGACGLRWLGCEHGSRRRNASGQDIEPFGFVDGLSQPRFYASDVAKEHHRSGGSDLWDPAFPLGQVLVRTEETGRETYGSFCVLRKLEQDVPRFRASLDALADALGLAGSDRDRAGAMIVGRFADGTPLERQEKPGGAPAATNNFDYLTPGTRDRPVPNQGDGSRCPFFAHIRKANPRLPSHRSVVFARRGMPYGGTPLADGETEGLLFLGYMSNLRHQFLTVHSDWIPDPQFPLTRFTGSDPLLLAEHHPGHLFPRAWGDATRGTVAAPDLRSFVTPRGGEYFFVPPKCWL